MRNHRQNKIDVAVAQCLSLAAGFLLPDSIIRADAARLVVPRPSNTEVDESIAYHDNAGRLTSVHSETEQKRKLNEQGNAWLLENR